MLKPFLLNFRSKGENLHLNGAKKLWFQTARENKVKVILRASEGKSVLYFGPVQLKQSIF